MRLLISQFTLILQKIAQKLSGFISKAPSKSKPEYQIGIWDFEVVRVLLDYTYIGYVIDPTESYKTQQALKIFTKHVK